jgi:hypothetical protein
MTQAAFNEDDDAPEISLEAYNKLARWRSKLDQTPKLNKRGVFEKAADDLFLEAEFERDLGAAQAIGDAIYVLGRDHTGLDDDSIQFVMAGAKGRIEQLNGNSKHSEEPPPAMSPEEYGQQRNKRTQSEPIALRYFSDLKEATPKLWLIKNVIARGETSSWIGPPGAGKSALLGDVCVHGAGSPSWRGHRIKQQFGSLYLALERGDLVKRRMIAHRLRDSLPTDLPIAVSSQVIDLMNRGCVGDILDAIKRAEDHLSYETSLRSTPMPRVLPPGAATKAPPRIKMRHWLICGA